MALLLLFFVLSYSFQLFTFGCLRKAGVSSTKALIPYVGMKELMLIIGKPGYWAILSFLPVSNVFVFVTASLELAKSFGKEDFIPQALALLFPFAYFPYIGFKTDIKYVGEGANMPKIKKPFVREWADAILFAVLAATIIRWSTFELYTIPTPSMEGDLLVGDFLFVNKLSFGSRSPITPLQIPLTHQSIWFTADEQGHGGKKSYSDAIQLPYFRFPGYSNTINRNEILVFNWPADPDHSPIDLKTNYIKRCTAIPGDKLEIKKSVLYINDAPADHPDMLQFMYYVTLKPGSYGLGDKFYKRHQLIKSLDLQHQYTNDKGSKVYLFTLDKHQVEAISKEAHIESVILNDQHESIYCANLSSPKGLNTEFDKTGIKEVSPISKSESGKDIIYFKATRQQAEALIKSAKFESLNTEDIPNPNGKSFARDFLWDVDMYGPITMPAEGMVITMDKKNVQLYGSTIIRNEHVNNVEVKNDQLFIDGKVQTEYTFKQNYYFLMGDNRHNSLDSRFWGFVPEDHIVGKAGMIFFSLSPEEGGIFSRIRWERTLNLID